MPTNFIALEQAKLDAQLAELEGIEAAKSFSGRTEAGLADIAARGYNVPWSKQQEIFANAKQLGIDTADAKNKLRESRKSQYDAGAIGTIDGFLMGIMPDAMFGKWYNNPENERMKNNGKILGMLLSLGLNPEGNLFRRVFGMGKTGKALLGAGKAASTIGTTIRTAEEIDDILSAAKALRTAEKAAKTAKAGKGLMSIEDAATLVAEATALSAKAGATGIKSKGVANTIKALSPIANVGELTKLGIRVVPTIPKTRNMGLGESNTTAYSNKSVDRFIDEWRMQQQMLNGLGAPQQ